MTRDSALHILRQHAADFKASGVAHLRLFGSVARDEAGPESDVDILADFDPAQPEAMFRIGNLQQDLELVLGVHVDLSVESWLKPLVRVEAVREQVYAFRGPLLHFTDILDAILWIERYVDGLTLDAYERDIKTRDAVERRLQIVTEAIIRLRDEAKVYSAEVDWAGLRGLATFFGMVTTRSTTGSSGRKFTMNCQHSNVWRSRPSAA